MTTINNAVSSVVLAMRNVWNSKSPYSWVIVCAEEAVLITAPLAGCVSRVSSTPPERSHVPAAMVRSGRQERTSMVWLVTTILPLVVGCAASSERTGRIVQLLSPPTNVQRTTDPAVCAQHIPIPLFAGALCASELATPNELVLVWDWQDTIAPLPFDVGPPQGYRIYVSYNGQPPIFTGRAQTDGNLTGSGLTDANPTTFRCYTVRAYHDATESPDSNAVCFGSPEGNTITTQLPPTRLDTFRHYEHSDTDFFTQVGGEPAPEPGQIRSGNGNEFHFSPIGKDDWAWEASRGAVLFNLGPVGSHPVWRAVLHLHHVNTVSIILPDCDPVFDHCVVDKYCGGTAGASTTNWTGGLPDGVLPDFAESYDLSKTLPFDGDVKVDVTPTVRQWVQGTPNNGFIVQFWSGGFWRLKGYCYDYWDQPTLEVTFFK